MAITWKQTVGWLGTVAVLLVVGACGGGTPEPTPEPEPVVEPDTGPSEAELEAQRRREAERREREAREAEARRRASERRRVEEILTERVHFDFDKSDIRPGDAEILQRKVAVLRQYSGIRLRIEGNCDERGSIEYNLALGQRRAEAVVSFLSRNGLDEDRFVTISYGKERPIAMGHDESAWAQNRRDDFVVLSLGGLAGD